MFRIHPCCNHILSTAEGFRGQEAILNKGSRDGPLFSGGEGGVQLFPGGGVQMLISIETHIHTCYFPGGVSGPLSPLGPHMGNVIINGQYLSQSGL